MAGTRSGGKRPASIAETGPPDSSSGKRRKVTQVRKKAKATVSSPTSSSSKAVAPSSPSPKKRPASRPSRRKTTSPLRFSRSAHGMRTRAKARVFRFLDLPAEIRNAIYVEAYGSDEPVKLDELRFPKELKVPQLYSEGLPFFFENTPIVIPVISNWCVRYQHLHLSRHTRYEQTGVVDVPRILEEVGLSEKVVRFQRLHFEVKCCCCEEGKVILSVDVEVIKKSNQIKALAETEVVNRQNVFAEVVDGLDKMSVVVKERVDQISRREGFNGFTVADIKDLALCFRDDSDGGKSRDHEIDG